MESDNFQFRIHLKDQPLSRRGILSTISSIFDPLGLVAPFLLQGKKILQELCVENKGWDDPICDEVRIKWEKWRNQLLELERLQIPRCYKTADFGKLKCVEMHHFSDACQTGYGECSYLRLIDIEDKVSCCLVMAKSRVAPIKMITIPRLELTAAVTAVKVHSLLNHELEYDNVTNFLWTDSKVVLGYISNESRRFHVFVANRVQQIRDNTTKNQWNFIESKQNPADIASRGTHADELITCDKWWHGPEFLLSKEPLPLTDNTIILSKNDPEVKKVTAHLADVKHDTTFDLSARLKYFSSWHRAKRAVAICLRFKARLRARTIKKTHNHPKNNDYVRVSVAEICAAEIIILKSVQLKSFANDIVILNGVNADRRSVKKGSSLYQLDPYICDDGLIRVGGRIKRANIPRELAHPVILPKIGHITNLIIDHYHRYVQHSGRSTTLNEIRAHGYWIIQGRTAITAHLRKCVLCKKLRGRAVGQKMSDLPVDRLEPAPPFTYSAVDYFGPFYVKEGRSQKKRWGCLFTCCVTRAVHIEVAHALTTDAFLNAYRRFVGRRGAVRQLRCDRGTNFVGAKNELQAALCEMNDDDISVDLLKDNCDWIKFEMNVPHASHMGGIWERMIRSARNALSALLIQHGSQLDDDLLHTLMIEAEAIINSRPLTYVDMTSCDADEPLTPSQLLTLKSKVVLPPPGQFVKEDMYCRRRWRRVQFLANDFWGRWRREFLPALQKRRKWTDIKDNLIKGDIVLMVSDDLPRCQWPRAIVINTHPSEDGLVRKVTIKTPTSELDRPVHKLVFLYRSGNAIEML